MSLFERGPRDGGQSDPSTTRSLRKLQGDPVRLASLLAGANSVVPLRRRRRTGFLTASATTVLLLFSAVEAPDLFAAVGLTGDQDVAAGHAPSALHNPQIGTGTATRPWATTQGFSTPGSITPRSATPGTATGGTKASAKAQPLTRAASMQPSASMVDRFAPTGTPTPTPTATPTTHGKAKGHGKPGTASSTPQH